MKKVVLLAFVLMLSSTALSLCVVGLLELQVVYASPYTSIDVDTAYNMITNGSYPDLVVLDVRTKSEYDDDGHIYGAVWIPVSDLETRIGELAGHENHEIIVYCLSGGRSATASGILDSYGFTKVYNMLGGISAWQSAGYPVWNATVHNVNTTFNYDTIQAAIDAPQTLDGHTIRVDAGTYYENVVVNKTASLIGENKQNTTIDGSGTGTVVQITANNVNISRFTIQNGFWGIDLDGSNNIVSGNNVVSNERVGILLGGSNNTLRDNNITGSQLNLYLYSWAAGKAFNHDIGPSNTVDGKPIYYLVNQHNQQIPQDAGYVAAVNCTNITVRNLNLQKNIHGVFFVNTTHSTIENVTILDTPYGIFLRDSNNNTIYKNTVSGLWEMQDGIRLEGSGNNVSFNTLRVENGIGVYIYRHSGNTVSNNNFTECGGGIRLDYSENNIIYHNNFIDNWVYQAILYPEPYNNTWDDGYPSGGNYWSDYIATANDTYSGLFQSETGSDGIGDTSYIIDANNTDTYPLMGPISFFNAGTWNEVTYYVDAVSNSTVTDFYFNPQEGAFIKFNVTGSYGTTGFCRVAIPKTTLWVKDGQWLVLVDSDPVIPTIFEDSNYTYLYFTYSHSKKTVEIRGTDVIPEFPTWTPMLLILIVITVAVAIYKRRLLKTPIH